MLKNDFKEIITRAHFEDREFTNDKGEIIKYDVVCIYIDGEKFDLKPSKTQKQFLKYLVNKSNE